MKNSKLRRVLMLVASAVLLVSLSVGATLAYLTSTTGVVENTFTVGKVVLDDPSTPNLNEGLDEADTDEYGEVVSETRVQGNEYKLIPGHTYVKDPVVYVQEGSEPCLVYVIVDDPLSLIIANSYAEGLNKKNISEQMDAEWHIIGNDGGTKTLYGYKTVVDAREEQVPLDTFKYITIAPWLSHDDLKAYAGKEITVQAFAIQADGLMDAYSDDNFWLGLRNIWEGNFSDKLTLVPVN